MGYYVQTRKEWFRRLSNEANQEAGCFDLVKRALATDGAVRAR